MKNIQVIDGAENCVYDIFSITDEQFDVLFPDQQDIEFMDDLEKRVPTDQLQGILASMWENRIPKRDVSGIHGILFFQLPNKKAFYPTKRDEEAVNPDGTPLRKV